MFAVVTALLLMSSTAAASQTRESFAGAADRLARKIAISESDRPQARANSEWNKVRRLPDVSVVQVAMRDGSLKNGHLGLVTDDGIVLLTAAALPPDARDALLFVAKTQPNLIERRAFRYQGLTVENGAIAFEGTRIADVDSVINEIERDAIAAIRRPVRGSLLGGVLGAAAGGLLGLYSAAHLAFKQCGDSCSDEGLLIVGALGGLPIVGGFIGAKVMPHPEWTTVYRRR